MKLTVKDLSQRNHSIEISKKLEWVIPYVKKARQLGLPVWRIRKIRGYVVPICRIEQQSAAMHKYHNHRKFVIAIPRKRQLVESTGEPGVIRVVGHVDALENGHFEDTLNSLAHEIAHLSDFTHTPDRFILECKLMVSFSKLAKRLGYKGYK